MPPAASLDAVPDEVLVATVLERLECHQALCALNMTSRRFKALTGDEKRWEELFRQRWGDLRLLQRRAAELAGGFKRLYASKAVTDKTAAPWTRPCPEEVRASVEALCRRTAGPGQQVAVVFLVDGSGSVNAEEFEAMLSFVTDATAQLRAAVEDCQVAVVQFSNDVRVECPLGPADPEALQKTTRDMVRMNGGTNVSVAVAKAGQLLKRDAAPGAMRHVVLLTDGRVDSYQAHEARQVADQLADEQRHVSLFAYGVGRGVDRAELLHIIGGPPTCAAVANGVAAAAAANAAAAAVTAAAAAAAGPAAPTAAPAVAAATGGEAEGKGEGSAPASGAYLGLSAWGVDPEDRYLALCVRDEAPW
ncbi:hypothetical protein HYH03_003256 [Edaphochlamys debaryana]|uniref:VWFA domain-containing protein n=1 Tax=Edaphochlamys debaryana TaxID=47281 RepID=A0A835YD46_9CHLO|nr:hypothetical protein HYH03_003256 [Edaphochlamys debaryana]|eukprot:KAG2499073.1 hypothetical protein HYH03_003256 [Edaphochlamys debaryana]